MGNDTQQRADMDYAAYLVRVRSATLEAAIDELVPRAGHNGSAKPGCFAESTASNDYFVFYQDKARWAWRRVNQSETVVDASSESFGFYLQCVIDARRHGWSGRPLSLFAATDFCRCSCAKVT